MLLKNADERMEITQGNLSTYLKYYSAGKKLLYWEKSRLKYLAKKGKVGIVTKELVLFQ